MIVGTDGRPAGEKTTLRYRRERESETIPSYHREESGCARSLPGWGAGSGRRPRGGANLQTLFNVYPPISFYYLPWGYETYGILIDNMWKLSFGVSYHSHESRQNTTPK